MDLTLLAGHRYASTADEVIPRSHGDSATDRRNLRHGHLTCNSSRVPSVGLVPAPAHESDMVTTSAFREIVVPLDFVVPCDTVLTLSSTLARRG